MEEIKNTQSENHRPVTDKVYSIMWYQVHLTIGRNQTFNFSHDACHCIGRCIYTRINIMAKKNVLVTISCYTILVFYQFHAIQFYSCINFMAYNFIPMSVSRQRSRNGKNLFLHQSQGIHSNSLHQFHSIQLYSCINLMLHNCILASISCHTILFFYQSHVIHFYSSINPMSYIFILASISCHTILFFYQSHVIHFYSCIILMLNNFILLCRLYWSWQ